MGIYSKVPDFVKSFRQHVAHESTQQFDIGHRSAAITASANDDMGVGDCKQAAIREGYAMSVASKVFDDVLGPVE
jgi:hypothetical protein